MRARHAASKARLAAESEAERGRAVREMFAQPIRDYLYQMLGRPIAVLRAGCRAPIEELGLEELRASGYEISVTTVDQDSPAGDTAGTGSILRGDLRMVPLPPRSFDIVYCGFLLERIPHAALVLDRFVAALRPGGLLLLRVRDRDCAAAALDRMAPEPVRRMLWARLHAGEPGPFPAIYDSRHVGPCPAGVRRLPWPGGRPARDGPHGPWSAGPADECGGYGPGPGRMAEPGAADRWPRRVAVCHPQARRPVRPPGVNRSERLGRILT